MGVGPLIIKALTISGGSAVGAGGIYFSYPHIANLISPDQEETISATSVTNQVSDSNTASQSREQPSGTGENGGSSGGGGAAGGNQTS